MCPLHRRDSARGLVIMCPSFCRVWILPIFLLAGCKAGNVNYTIASSCDHVTRKFLAANIREQTKTIVRSHVTVAGQTGREALDLGAIKPGATECDVWTMKAAETGTDLTNLTLTLEVSSVDVLESSVIFIVSESSERQRLLFSSDGNQTQTANVPVRVESRSRRLSLVWAHRTKPGQGQRKADRLEQLSFSYWAERRITDPGSDVDPETENPVPTSADTTDNPEKRNTAETKEKERTEILTSALILCAVTAAATCLSIARAGICRTCRHHCMHRNLWKATSPSEADARQESLELNPLREMEEPPIPYNRGHNHDIIISNNNNICNNNTRNDSTNGHRNNRNFLTHEIFRERRSRDVRVLLELEVTAMTPCEERLALTADRDDLDLHSDNQGEASAARCCILPREPDAVCGDPDQTRRVRFHVDPDGPGGKGGCECRTIGDPDEGSGVTQMSGLAAQNTQVLQPKPTPSSPSPQLLDNTAIARATLLTSLSTATTSPPTTLISTGASAITPTTTAVMQQSLASSCCSQTLSNSSSRSPLSVVPPGPSTFRTDPPPSSHLSCMPSQPHRSSIFGGDSHHQLGNPIDSALITTTGAGTAFPSCELNTTGGCWEFRGWQPRQLVRHSVGISSITSLNPQPPTYRYGSTPPPAYSSLFPE